MIVSMQLLGPNVASKQTETVTVISRIPAVDVHGIKCIHADCNRDSIRVGGNHGWLCEQHYWWARTGSRAAKRIEVQ